MYVMICQSLQPCLNIFQTHTCCCCTCSLLFIALCMY